MLNSATKESFSLVALRGRNTSTFLRFGSCHPPESGFYYLQSRYYDPNLCRFINADGLASTGQGFIGCNMFAYCLNDPVIARDSCGGAPTSCISVQEGHGGGLGGDESDNSWSIFYDVPLFNQGNRRMCWAYSVLMVYYYRTGKDTKGLNIDIIAEALSKAYNGENDWDKGVPISEFGEKETIDTVSDLFLLLYDKGPVFARYYTEKSGKIVGHIVVVTGVDIDNGRIYTNNPWNVYGCQSFDEFFQGFVGLDGETVSGYEFDGIYVPY